jgi:hypothetical protein
MPSRSTFAALALLLFGCGGEDGGGSGPSRIDVLLVSSAESFENGDGLSGQPARALTAGVRSLTLLSDSGEPWLVIDRGQGDITVGFDAGQKTLLGAVLPDKVVPGRYVRARLVESWVHFEVDATLHEASGATPGITTTLLVVSDGTSVGGVTHDAGFYAQDFVGSTKSEQFTGQDGVVPEHTTSADVETVVEDGEWAHYFPIDLEVTSRDAVLTLRANVHEAFRWQDVDSGDNQAGVWDIAPPVYEPVRQLGPNAFDVVLENR